MSNVFGPRGRRMAVLKPIRSDFKKNFSTSHCRRGRAMERLVEHAFVAQVEEVLFCEHTVSSLDSVVPISHFVPSEVHTLGQLDERRIDTNGHGNKQDASFTSIQALQEDADAGFISSRPAVGIGDITSNSTHPSDPLRERLGPVSHSWHPSDSNRISGWSGTARWRMSEAGDGDPNANEDLNDSSPTSLQLPGDLTRTTEHDVVLEIAYDEYLAVGDYEGYDFAGFMGRWVLLRGHDNASQQHQAVMSHETRHSATVDMQGLNWNVIGINRSEALHRRYLLNPERRKQLSLAVSGQIPAIDTAETLYRFRRYTSTHRAQPSHHQLRHVLASSGRGNILYAAGDKVTRTSLACPGDCEPVIDCSALESHSGSFRITCIATPPTQHGPSHDVVLVGGFNGEYTIRNLRDQDCRPVQGFVSHAYNGVVTHISTNHDRKSGLLRAAFSSNDQNLRIMDVTTSRFIATHPFNHAINCSALSADSRLRVVVGDEVDALIVDSDTGTALTQLKGHYENVFTCAWSPNGRYVATGAEDGLIMIWDARNWTTPVQTQKCQMATPRSTQFADDGSLIVAEDDDVVCVYEPELFERQQSIRFFGSVAGMTLIDGGDEVVVANADTTVGGLLSFTRRNGRGRAGRRGRWGWSGTEFDVLV